MFKIGRILAQVKHRQNEMIGFSPNNVIFVINKWDTLCMETDLKKERFIKKTMETLRNVWGEVDASCILKLSVNIECLFRVCFIIINNCCFYGYFHPNIHVFPRNFVHVQ